MLEQMAETDARDHFYVHTSNPSSPSHDPDDITLSRTPGANQAEHIMQSIESHSPLHSSSGHSSRRNSSGPSGDEGNVFEEDDRGRHSSPGTSHDGGSALTSDCDTDDKDGCISSLVSDSTASEDDTPRHFHTPVRQRTAFRTPSSVRAMQLETTPPPPAPPPVYGSPRSKKAASSRNGTPRSARSGRLGMMSPAKKLKREYPLVLLHVTLLPVILPYPLELMTEVVPESIMENYKTLMDKVNETVLERGILLPHPKEDYELLEERLLESLELELPRILKCGHFHCPEGDEEESEEESDDEEEDVDRCEDCGRHVRNGLFGDAGSGRKRRYNVKLYAANGLMRAGAWIAAWREMERVDVEIEPWIPEEMRRELDARVREKRRLEEEEDLRKRWEAEQQQEREREAQGTELPTVVVNTDELEADADPEDEQKRRLREIYGEEAVPTDGFAARAPARTRLRREDIPLGVLLKNYFTLLAQDKRNVVIFLLSLLVLILSSTALSTPKSAIADMAAVPSSIREPPVAVISSTIASATEAAASLASKLGTKPETLQDESCQYPSDTGCATVSKGDAFGHGSDERNQSPAMHLSDAI